MRNWTAWIGAKYGTLTVEKYLGNQGTKNTFFLVRCDCGKTKKDFSMENGIHYKDIRVQRLPWADKYGDVDSIPVEEWLNHGWYFICDTCGAEIDDIKDFHVNSRGYCCKKCFNEGIRI